jgi:hypothetical protein
MATYFLHPEVPIKSSGLESVRCYFDRYSQVEANDDEMERSVILAETNVLKRSAVDYLHPERGVVTTDPCAFGRNYFTRFSAPHQEENELVFRDHILADAFALKQSAVDFLHPEISVKTTDATVYGRNYFSRYSAPSQESLNDIKTRDEIVHDAIMLRHSAEYYLHPELPVRTNGATIFGRNYFVRASGPIQESYEDIKITQQVLEDSNAFHQLAVEYLHPELPLIIYATSTGRNYFNRGTSPEYDSLGDFEARTQVMEDLTAFKTLARDYLHPELPLVVYATSTGRNYFTRPDAEDCESFECMEERGRILAESNALKVSAVHFLHPERSVATTDGAACGRNYFSRFSAPNFETPSERESRDVILADMKALSQAALDYLHPEIQEKGAICCARNYYSRPSATMYNDLDQVAEREHCLSDARSLKKLSVDFMHPELPIVVTDGAVCARNYFNRFSAPLSVTMEEEEDRSQILADTSALRKLAFDFMHPEIPVASAVTCARNYFDRPSFKLHRDMIHSFPAHAEDDEDDNSDHHHNEHIDHFGMMDEEMELYHDLRAELEAFPMKDSNTNRSTTSKFGTSINKADSEVESNLSRSPSSVFLFGMEDSAYD